ICAQAAEYLEAVDEWHRDVKHGEVGPVHANAGERLRPVRHSHHLVTRALEHRLDQREDVRVIVCDEDQSSSGHPCAPVGSSTQKEVPSPGSLRTAIEPPRASTIARAM